MKKFNVVALAIAIACLLVYGSAWLQAPPNSPIITTLPGHVVERGDIRWQDGSMLYSVTEHTVVFEEISGRTLYLIAHSRHGGIYEGKKYFMQYQEQWRWNFKDFDFRRQSRLVSMREVAD